jgi:hypothetical protein
MVIADYIAISVLMVVTARGVANWRRRPSP